MFENKVLHEARCPFIYSLVSDSYVNYVSESAFGSRTSLIPLFKINIHFYKKEVGTSGRDARLYQNKNSL
jgi:hypothetical protein